MLTRLTFALLAVSSSLALAADEPPLTFTVKLETAIHHNDGKFLWFHPRAVTVPGDAGPSIVMTIQKHLRVSDYFSGLSVMTRPTVDSAWQGPIGPPELDWKKLPEATVSVADVTPGWHAPTGKVIALGCQVRYDSAGHQMDDIKRAHQTVYAVLDPKSGQWQPWQVLEMPPGDEFNFARNACAQWLVQPDGKLLVPLYIGKSSADLYKTTVAQCSFDGQKMTVLRHGNVLKSDVRRGLYEPSLIAYRGRYYLTLRNDKAGYVATSDDGLQFGEPQAWTFDDGLELGSYNTQQHWLAHSDGLFLVYTRRGANNDHVFRHRAPLFMAQVDVAKLHVVRATEQVVVPERGAELGNFGANPVSPSESWVTVSEGAVKDPKRGANGSTYVARIQWSRPNQFAAPSAGR